MKVFTKPELDVARVNSLDASGARIHLHPAEVKGWFRTRKNQVQSALLGLFFFLPWLQWQGRPLLVLDIYRRQFYFGPFELGAHNAPLLVFVILGASLMLAFVTSRWGRVWCGWSCPQTVFIEAIFRRIEAWIEGDYLQRREASKNSLTLQRFFKKSIKWLLYGIIAWATSMTLMMYFVGIRSHWGSTTWIIGSVVAILLLIDFGWFREQFCTIACPYGRIQGLLIDGSTRTVMFDQSRKEDCVNCHRCVSACPIGIDIRNGLQLECTSCTACIDACDEIMTKVKKPLHLIKIGQVDQTENVSLKAKIQSRSWIYLFGVLACATGLAIGLKQIKHSEAALIRNAANTFITHRSSANIDSVTNQFHIHLTNQSSALHRYRLKLANTDVSTTLTTQQTEVTIGPKSDFDWHLFLTTSMTQDKVLPQIKLILEDADDQSKFQKEFIVKLIKANTSRD